MEVKIVIISDTHNKHQEITIPPCDILIHAGDFTGRGNKPDSENFLEWFSMQNAKFKVYIAGNHEVLWDRGKNYDHKHPLWLTELQERYSHLFYLEHSSVELCGINIFGSPYSPEFFPEYWGFNVKRGPQIASKWAEIPSNTNILISHGPAKGHFDYVPMSNYSHAGYPSGHVGCEDLMNRIPELPNLQVVAVGHIHSGHGRKELYMDDGQRQVTYVNASIVNEAYEVAYEPHIITLEV